MKLRIGLMLGSGNFEEIVLKSVKAEQTGFDSVVLGDHIVYPPSTRSVYDSWSLLTAIAQKTSRLQLSTLVTDPFRRHPALLAQTVSTLNIVSHGRAFLMIGAGEPMNVEPIGIPFERPVSRLDEFVRVFRLMLQSTPKKPVNFEGKFFKLHKAFLQLPPQSIQTYIAGDGNKSISLAAMLGDGYVNLCDTGNGYGEKVEKVRTNLFKLGREMSAFDLALFQRMAIANSKSEAEEILMKNRIGFAWFTEKMTQMGYKVSNESKLKLTRFNMDMEEDLLTIASDLPFEAVRNFACCGTVDDCADQLEPYLRAGARYVFLSNLNKDDESFSHLAKELLGYLHHNYSSID